MLDTGYWMLDAGCWILVTGWWKPGAEEEIICWFRNLIL
jgi:hypothetical protein